MATVKSIITGEIKEVDAQTQELADAGFVPVADSVTPPVPSPTPTAPTTSGILTGGQLGSLTKFDIANPDATLLERQSFLSGLNPLGQNTVDRPITGLTTPADFAQQQEDRATEIRREQADAARGRVKDIERQFEGIIREERVAGEGRVGQTRSRGARAGLLGSSFGAQQKAGTEVFNRQQQQFIQEQKTNQINAVFDKFDRKASERIAEERNLAFATREEQTVARDKFILEGKQIAASIGQQGISYDELDNDDKNELREQTQMTDLGLQVLINSSMPPEEQIDFQTFWRGDTLVMVGQNPKTGQIETKTFSPEDLGLPAEAEKPANPEFVTNKISGEVFWFDKDGQNKDAEGNLILNPIGKFGESKAEREELERRRISISGGNLALAREKFAFDQEIKMKEAIDGKPATSAQFKSAGFAVRLKQANNIFDELKEGGFEAEGLIPGIQRSALGSFLLPERLKSEEIKRQEQAERNFVNAILRQESGAAIGKDEFTSAELQYFPRSGDSETVLRQKKANRALVQNSFEAQSGNALEQIEVPTVNDEESGSEVQNDDIDNFLNSF